MSLFSNSATLRSNSAIRSSLVGLRLARRAFRAAQYTARHMTAAKIFDAVTGQTYNNAGLANFMYRVANTPIQTRKLKR